MTTQGQGVESSSTLTHTSAWEVGSILGKSLGQSEMHKTMDWRWKNGGRERIQIDEVEKGSEWHWYPRLRYKAGSALNVRMCKPGEGGNQAFV